MCMKKGLVVLSLVGLISFADAKEIFYDFEDVVMGTLPSSWESSSLWKVENDKNPPSGKQILTMKKNNNGFMGLGSGYNTCFAKDIDFKDGEISVKFRANTGRVDQGGGIMWRVQDKDNYYVARFNPLEDNFRFYKVVNGNRSQLKSANITLAKGWHSMKIIQNGSHFEGYINNQKMLDAKDDTIKQSGGVGVWTKADAVTSFDDLKVKSTQ